MYVVVTAFNLSFQLRNKAGKGVLHNVVDKILNGILYSFLNLLALCKDHSYLIGFIYNRLCNLLKTKMTS